MPNRNSETTMIKKCQYVSIPPKQSNKADAGNHYKLLPSGDSKNCPMTAIKKPLAETDLMIHYYDANKHE
jgi:hypothetical protein